MPNRLSYRGSSLKNLSSTARAYDQQALSPSDPTAIWHSHLALAIYIFVVVNFDALAQASDFRIKRRQVVFLCWMQDSNPEVLWNPIFSRLYACWQTDWAIEDQAKKLELDSPSLWSASIQPTWAHWHLAFAPGSGDIHICCCWFRCSGTGKRFSNRKETNFLPLLNGGFGTQRVSETQSSADWMPADKPTELSRIKLKKLELNSPSLWSASIQPTWPHRHLAFAPGSGDIHICCCSFRCFGTGKRFSNQKETNCLPLLNAGFEPRGSLKPNLQQTGCLLTNRLSYWGSS